MKPYLIREPDTSELYETLIVLYRSFDRLIPLDINDQVKLLINLINSKIAKFLIAERDKKIFGLGALFTFQDVGSIGYMGVLPEFRHNGVGTSIFSKLINMGKAIGCKTFLLYASKLGEPIYHKFGFRSKYKTGVYELPSKSAETIVLNEDVKILKNFPEWVAQIDRTVMGFNRFEFLNIKLNHGSKLIVRAKEGYALISGERLGPLVAKNLQSAVNLINMGISLGANHMIVPKHAKFPNGIFELIELVEVKNEVNLNMIYGKNVSQKLDYFIALGTYAKG